MDITGITISSWSRGFNGRYLGNVDDVVISVMQKQDAARLYLEGQIEAIGLSSLPADVRRSLVQQRPADFESTPTPCTWHLWFQMSRPPVDNLELRRAPALAIDRDVLAARAAEGTALPADGGLVPPGIPGHVPKIALSYDPEAARRALARAGFSLGREPLRLEVVSPPGTLFAAVISELTQQWRTHLGVELITRSIELAEFTRLSPKVQPHVWFLGWCADYPDPDSFLRVASWRRVGGWRDEAYERLMREARRSLEPETRLAKYRQMEEILVAEAPVVPLLYPWGPGLIQRWVSPMPFLSTGGGVKVDETIIRPH